MLVHSIISVISINLLSATILVLNIVQSESHLMWAGASPSGFPYPFSISLTCGFAFQT